MPRYKGPFREPPRAPRAPKPAAPGVVVLGPYRPGLESEKAKSYLVAGKWKWIPRSVITREDLSSSSDSTTVVVHVQSWFAKKEGLVP